MKQECYGVDLDGTLAEYHGWKDPSIIGEPIQPMVEKVKEWISQGIKVVIFTARAYNRENIKYIKWWLYENGFPNLDVTCMKNPSMSRFYDDRAIQVEKNTGRIISDELSLDEYKVVE